jgi:Trm5-related predicted tRNA methylase
VHRLVLLPSHDRSSWSDCLSPTFAQAEKRSGARLEREKRRRADALQLSRVLEAQEKAPKVIVDLGFWDKMTEQERRSLVSQLGFCVGSNKKANAPCSLHFTRRVTTTRLSWLSVMSCEL